MVDSTDDHRESGRLARLFQLHSRFGGASDHGDDAVRDRRATFSTGSHWPPSAASRKAGRARGGVNLAIIAACRVLMVRDIAGPAAGPDLPTKSITVRLPRRRNEQPVRPCFGLYDTYKKNICGTGLL